MYVLMSNLAVKAYFFVGLFLVALSVEAQEDRIYKVPKFAEEWSKPSKHPDRIVLNFTEDPSTAISVTWRTSPQVTKGYAEVALATAAPKFWRNAITVEAETTTMDASMVETAEVVSNYHSVTFTGLIPDTLYAYRVGNGEIWSEWVQFRTASATPKPFSFLYVGDAQNFILELWSRLIREGYRKVPDASFIIHAGDLVSEAHSEQQWHEWFTAGGWIHRMLPSIPLVGNHEYEPYTAEEDYNDIEHLSMQWRPQFTLPTNGPDGLEETAYYLDYQDMRVVVLNTNEKQEIQAEWLSSVLEESTAKWNVVTFHHPLYSASAGRDNKELRDLWKPLFDKHKVDIVLQGHDHSYARGRAPADESQNLVDGMNARDSLTGTVYVVSVSGGKMYRLRPDAWESLEGADRDRAAENTQLFQVIRIDGDRLSFEAYTATGELYDAFDLVKNKKGGSNHFIDRQGEAIPERRHENTINYRDRLPDFIRDLLMERHPGFVFDKVRYVKDFDFHGFYVEMEQYEKDIDVEIKIDISGEILEEVIDED